MIKTANREILSRFRGAYTGIIIADMVNRGKLPTSLLPGNQILARDIELSRKKPKEEEDAEDERI